MVLTKNLSSCVCGLPDIMVGGGSVTLFVGMVIAASSRNVEERRRTVGLSVALVGSAVLLAGVASYLVRNIPMLMSYL